MLQVDEAVFSEGAMLEVNLPAGRMVYSPTGPLTDYHDVRSFGEAAKKGIFRFAIFCNCQKFLDNT